MIQNTKFVCFFFAEDANQRKCPPSCKCTNEFGLVDCSHQNFTQIPNNLPQNTVELNLSHNLLTTLNVSDLIIGKELQQLNLNNNQIETIIDTDVSVCLSITES